MTDQPSGRGCMMADTANREAVMTDDDQQKKQASDARQQGVFIIVLTVMGAVLAMLLIFAFTGENIFE